MPEDAPNMTAFIPLKITNFIDNQLALMFSQGQLIFGVLFAIAFTILAIFAYRQDAVLHKKYYKGNRWVLLAFIVFIGLIACIKLFLG